MYQTNEIKPQLLREEQPVAKLNLKGRRSLTDMEVLVIIAFGDVFYQDRIDQMRFILSNCENSLIELKKKSVTELVSLGLTRAQSTRIVAAFEFADRYNASVSITKTKISSSLQAYNHLSPSLRELMHEEFWVMYLNNGNKVITTEKISEGGLNSTTCDPRKILKRAIELQATGMILAHNHPSGNSFPSDADSAITEKLRDGASLFDITVVDHIIVAGDLYFSFRDSGKM